VREFIWGQSDGSLEFLCELNIFCTAVCGAEVSCEGVQWGTERR